MKPRWLAVLAVIAAALLAWDITGHYRGWRFAVGAWPVPQGTPWTYQLESGFVPALTVLSLVTLIVGAWHHVNCHAERCLRIGKHKVDGTPWCGTHQHQARELATATLQDVVDRLDSLLTLLAADRHRA